jgi:hypothetical protein
VAHRRLVWFGLVPLAVGCLALSACSPQPPPAAQRSAMPSQPPSSPSTNPSTVASPTAVASPVKSPVGSPTTTGSSPASVDVNSVALPQWSGAGCPQSGWALQQSVTGRFSQCLQVGGVPGGNYAIMLEQVLSPPTDVAPASPAMPGLQLTASPTSGPPGTQVTITGTLTTPISPRPGGVSLCWDGCPGGLSDTGETLDWLSPTTFRTTTVVPQAPWVTAYPPRVVPLVSGTYSIGVQCLQEAHACGLGGAEATTSFQLDVPAADAPSWCRTADSCAQLTVSPAHALPGEDVTVTGFAPVASLGADGEPFAYQLQVIPAPSVGPAVQFQPLGKAEATLAYFGFGALSVTAAPTFASINSASWSAQAIDGWQPITANPAMPSTTAWCKGGAIAVDVDGRTSTIPTGKAAQAALTAMGFPPSPGDAGPPTCETLALLGHGIAGAPAIVAGFGVEPADQEPLYADVALLTRDGGKTWTPLPTPRGVKPDSFGGFRYGRDAVTALFTPSGTTDPAPAMEATSDAGRTWRSAQLTCPISGPCVTFGAFQPGNCAKNGGYQPVIASTDGGHHWAVTSLDQNLDACWPAQLLTAADGSEVLVDSSSTFSVERSADGGRTWADIDIPPVPDRPVGDGWDGAVIGLPGGSLLATNQDITHAWMLLRPGATTWCDVRTPDTTNQDSVFYGGPRAIGDQLWWLTWANDSTGTTAHHVALAELTC